MSNRNIADVLRLATAKKPVRVAIDRVVIDPRNNVRFPDVARWDIEGIADDLALNGQMEPAILEKNGEQYFPLRGFRRCSGVKQNAEKGVIDPSTGKPFESVLAFVIDETLSEKERAALVIDAGNTKLLTKVEVFFAVERIIKLDYSVPQMTIMLRGLLDLTFPVKDPEVLSDDKRYTDYRRGVMQNLVAATRSPDVLREAYVAKLENKQKWPNEREVKMLVDAFEKEMKDDKTNKINKSNPGKLWLEKWAEFKAKKLATPEGTKPKSAAMMTGEDVSNAKNACNSRILKFVMDVVKRNLPQENLAILDQLLVDVEAGKADSEVIAKTLDGIAPPSASTEGGEEVGE